jgi:hypothetical protein
VRLLFLVALLVSCGAGQEATSNICDGAPHMGEWDLKFTRTASDPSSQVQCNEELQLTVVLDKTSGVCLTVDETCSCQHTLYSSKWCSGTMRIVCLDQFARPLPPRTTIDCSFTTITPDALHGDCKVKSEDISGDYGTRNLFYCDYRIRSQYDDRQWHGR